MTASLGETILAATITVLANGLGDYLSYLPINSRKTSPVWAGRYPAD